MVASQRTTKLRLSLNCMRRRRHQVLDTLRDLASRDIDTDLRDPDTRIVAVESVGCLCVEIEPSELKLDLETLKGHRVLGLLLESMDDYTTDNRGDIGSLVREAAMVATSKVCMILAERYERCVLTLRTCAAMPWVHAISLQSSHIGNRWENVQRRNR